MGETRKYYSVRTGKKSSEIDFGELRKLIYSVYKDLEEEGYFEEHFGSSCVDSGFTPGKAGRNVNKYVLRKIRKDLWPIELSYASHSEEDLFDVIEFLFDHISMPLEEGAEYHSWGDCGWHYSNYDAKMGQTRFTNEINPFLNDYGEGYEINSDGEILVLADTHMQTLVDAELPTYDPENIEEKIGVAVEKFRRYGSSIEDRTEAVRMLVDCLEFVRPEAKEVLKSKDESDLFNIANNFGIRHHNPNQKNDYDKSIWLSWMFYHYLATLHACLRLVKKGDKSKPSI